MKTRQEPSNPTLSVSARFMRVAIKGYQNGISPLLPARCRYYPTCSQYGLQAVAWHGSVKGGWLLAKRISRCHPLGGHGIDFVPLPLYRFEFYSLVKDKNKGNIPTINRFVAKNGNDYRAMMNVWLQGGFEY